LKGWWLPWIRLFSMSQACLIGARSGERLDQGNVLTLLACKKLMERRAVSGWALSCCDPNVTFFSKSENFWPTGSWPILSCASGPETLC
jgi:hypothetical protein